MSNMNFLIADVTSDTKITFSQGGATKIKSKQFSWFGSRTIKGQKRLSNVDDGVH